MSEINYHMTEVGALRSVGATDEEPGLYPATDTNAGHVVAPGGFVRSWLAEHGERQSEDAIAQAIRAWERTQ